jgi:hypothetical protein
MVLAKGATSEIASAKRRLAGLQSDIRDSSQQLNEIALTVRLQGPRAELLSEEMDDFIPAMKPHAGQRAVIALVECAPPGDYTIEEEQDLQYELKALLTMAGWKMEERTVRHCADSLLGVRILVSSEAPDSALSAAHSLSDELKALHFFTSNKEYDDVPPLREWGAAFCAQLPPNTPCKLSDLTPRGWSDADQDRGAVFISIGVQPPFEATDPPKSIIRSKKQK